MWSDRIAGFLIMLSLGLIAAGMIVVHSRSGFVRYKGGFFFIWTMFAVRTTGWFTAILAARELWTVFRARRSGVAHSASS